MIKAVLFDMDGTLVDSEFKAMSIKRRILEEHGVVWSQELCQNLAGRKLQLVIEEVLADASEETRQEILDEYYRPENKLFDYHEIKMPHSGTILSALYNNGYVLGLTTTNSAEYISRCLQQNHWQQYFSLIMGTKDVVKHKPDPEIFITAMERLNVTAEETVIIEDSRSGLLAAIASGAHVICRRETRLPIDQSGADYYIDDLLDIMNIVNELNEKEA